MKEQELFILADKKFNEVIQQIKDDQWNMNLPDDFPTFDPKKKYTLRETVNYHAYDEAWVPAMLSGKTMLEVGKDAFGEPFGNHLLGKHPKTNYAELSEKAVAAARDFPNDDLDKRMVHFTYGDFSAREAFWHMTSFRGMRVYDFSKVLGLNTDMSNKLVEGLWKMIKPHAEEWRKQGVFPPNVTVPANATLQDKLLGLTGRQPRG